VLTARKDDRAIANYNGAMKLDAKFAVTYETRGFTKDKMDDKAGADADLATAKAVQACNSGKHVKFGWLADATEKKEAALTPEEESTPEDKSAAKNAQAFRGSIGVSIRSVTDGAAAALNVKPARGALVIGIDENGPAEAAGIETRDVIVKIDGMDVKECRDLQRVVADTPAGKDVAVTIIRNGKELTKTVKVGQLEDADNAPQEKPVAVDPKSEAATKHLAPGMTIVDVQRQRASSASLLVVPPAPPRFGKRRTDHYNKVSR